MKRLSIWLPPPMGNTIPVSKTIYLSIICNTGCQDIQASVYHCNHCQRSTFNSRDQQLKVRFVVQLQHSKTHHQKQPNKNNTANNFNLHIVITKNKYIDRRLKWNTDVSSLAFNSQYVYQLVSFDRAFVAPDRFGIGRLLPDIFIELLLLVHLSTCGIYAVILSYICWWNAESRVIV